MIFIKRLRKKIENEYKKYVQKLRGMGIDYAIIHSNETYLKQAIMDSIIFNDVELNEEELNIVLSKENLLDDIYDTIIFNYDDPYLIGATLLNFSIKDYAQDLIENSRK